MCCENCGHKTEKRALYCGSCGRTIVRTDKTVLRLLYIMMAVIAAVATLMIQRCVMSSWLTVEFPVFGTTAVSPYDLRAFVDGIASVIGGVDLVDSMVFWVRVMVIAIQCGIGLMAVFCVGALWIRKRAWVWVGVVGGVICAVMPTIVLWKLNDILHLIKNKAVSEAVSVDAAPIVMIAAAAVMIAAAVMWRVLCMRYVAARKANGE